jgi:hypothetical protein
MDEAYFREPENPDSDTVEFMMDMEQALYEHPEPEDEYDSHEYNHLLNVRGHLRHSII